LRLKYSMNNIPIPNNKTIDEHAEPLVEDYNLSILPKLEAVDVETFAQNYPRLHFQLTGLSHYGFIWAWRFLKRQKL